VDFWDLSRLMLRRWWAAVPMLGLTFALMAFTYTTVKPNYTVTAYVVLVPPSATVDKQGELTQSQRNVWLSQGLLALANAASTAVLDPSVPVEMEAAGFSGSFVVQMTSASAVMTFTVTGTSAEQSTATATELVRRYSESVKLLQDQARIAPSDEITASRLGGSAGPVESNGNVKRALAAMGGAGLLLTAGATVGVDALLRRRDRRRLEMDEMPASMPDTLTNGPAVSRSPKSRSPERDRGENGTRATVGRPADNGAGVDRREAQRMAEVTAALAPTSPPVVATPANPATVSAATVVPDAGDPLARRPDREADTTIVLPLSFGSGRSGDGRRS
jgi:hypothetical protein